MKSQIAIVAVAACWM